MPQSKSVVIVIVCTTFKSPLLFLFLISCIRLRQMRSFRRQKKRHDTIMATIKVGCCYRLSASSRAPVHFGCCCCRSYLSLFPLCFEFHSGAKLSFYNFFAVSKSVSESFGFLHSRGLVSFARSLSFSVSDEWSSLPPSVVFLFAPTTTTTPAAAFGLPSSFHWPDLMPLLSKTLGSLC